MNLSQLLGDEKLFLKRLEDLREQNIAKNKTVFTHFLNERQIDIATEFALQTKLCSHMFFGGHADATRKVLGLFADYNEPNSDAFSIQLIRCSYKKDASLNHRDFLGSLMALKISRESIGDILIQDGVCNIFAQSSVTQTVLDELKKVGNFGVKTDIGVPTDFVVLQGFETMRCTIASLRLDVLVSTITNLSRDKTAALIKEGRVQRNFVVIENGAKTFDAGDTITIRGYGKYVVDEIGLPTKKSRLPVIIKKYI